MNNDSMKKLDILEQLNSIKLTETEKKEENTVIPNISEINDEDALIKLLSYKFKKRDQLGKIIRINEKTSKRIDILRDPVGVKYFKNMKNLLIIIKQLSEEKGNKPSYGLKIENGYRPDFVHFLYEYKNQKKEGLFYIDQKRPLSVKSIHKIEKTIIKSGIDSAIIVANKVGIPALREVDRINDFYDPSNPKMRIEHFNSIDKRFHQ